MRVRRRAAVMSRRPGREDERVFDAPGQPQPCIRRRQHEARAAHLAEQAVLRAGLEVEQELGAEIDRVAQGRRDDVAAALRADAHALGTHADDDGDSRQEVAARRERAERGLDQHFAAAGASYRAGEPRRQADEVQGEGGGGRVVDLSRPGELLDGAAIHDRDAIGHHQRLVLVVGDEDRGGAELAQQAAQLDLHRLAQLAVERAEGLVEQHQLGADREGARDGDALLLAAREHLHRPVGELGEMDQGEEPLDGRRAPVGLYGARLQPEGDVLGDR
jgi:hypothetical protein